MMSRLENHLQTVDLPHVNLYPTLYTPNVLRSMVYPMPMRIPGMGALQPAALLAALWVAFQVRVLPRKMRSRNTAIHISTLWFEGGIINNKVHYIPVCPSISQKPSKEEL